MGGRVFESLMARTLSKNCPVRSYSCAARLRASSLAEVSSESEISDRLRRGWISFGTALRKW